MNRQEPWLVESAIKLIQDYLHTSFKVFEFGSGASTRWFARRSQIVAVEHDGNYAGPHITIRPRPYNSYIEEFPENYFDLILVDGRNRVKCIQSSLPHLKPGGWLVLDNSEREHYQAGITLMSDWNRIDCRQNRPDKYGFVYPGWQTSIFLKP